MSPYFGYPVIGPLLKRLADLEPDAHTQGYTLNLNANRPTWPKGSSCPLI